MNIEANKSKNIYLYHIVMPTIIFSLIFDVFIWLLIYLFIEPFIIYFIFFLISTDSVLHKDKPTTTMFVVVQHC